MPVTMNTSPQAHGSYAARVSDVLEQWGLLSGAAHFGQSARRALLRRALANRSGDADRHSPSRLCADGSPLEFCERLSETPNAPACTIDLGPSAGEPLARLQAAVQWLEAQGAGNAHRTAVVDARLVRAVYIGLSGNTLEPVRLYVDLVRQNQRHDGRTSVALARAVVGGQLETQSPPALEFIATLGRLRLCGIDLGAQSGDGLKLAFALPLDETTLAHCTRSCSLDSAPFRWYLRALDRAAPPWRQVRTGLGIALDRAGSVDALTLYTYTAPYFRSDTALRETALGLARTFGWDATVYRASSRLIDDPAGTRVRTLLGFTVRRDGGTGLRIYGRSGHLG